MNIAIHTVPADGLAPFADMVQTQIRVPYIYVVSKQHHPHDDNNHYDQSN